MPLYSADALILRTYKLGEADRIVVFLTRDRGKKRGVAKGARRMRSNFAGALEPLTRYFEYWLLSLQGVYPASRVPGLSPEAQAFLHAARKVGPQELAGVTADRAMLRELEALHRSIIATHLEREPRSIKVLKDMTRL